MTRRNIALNRLPLSVSANHVLAAFKRAASIPSLPYSGAELLYERACLSGLKYQGNISPGGSCHVLPCADALLAVNLPRDSDWELIPAWLQQPIGDEITADQDWNQLAERLTTHSAAPLLDQAHLLGLAVSTADYMPPLPAYVAKASRFAPRITTNSVASKRKPVVVELASLWAGPLCGHLLQAAGCRVIKVEGRHRLDGARYGNAEFFKLLNQAKESIVLDFKNTHDIQALKQLIQSADIVIEGSRPRALRYLGIDAKAIIQSNPGKVWISITGYGRDAASEHRIGFGDDASAAAGFCVVMNDAIGATHMVGDAIADPLTGVHAALAAWQSLQNGGSELIDISLYNVATYCLQQELRYSKDAVLDSFRHWKICGSNLPELFAHGTRLSTTDIALPGEHTDKIVSEFCSPAIRKVL